MEINKKYPRNNSLEALRGIASVAVLFYHCTYWFPTLVIKILSNPFYIFSNGGSAVIFFFVLSGYVLTRAYFISGNNDILVLGAIKRWPRLMGPVLISVLFAYGLYKIGFVVISYHQNTQPTLKDAIYQGLFSSFFNGQYYYNGTLWTITFEFIGSFVCFFSAFILKKIYKNKNSIIFFGFFIFYIFSLFNFFDIECHNPIECYNKSSSPYSAAMPAGMFLAAFLPQQKNIKKTQSCVILLISIYFLNYFAMAGLAVKSMTPAGIYTPLNHLPESLRIYPTIFGAMLLISVVELYEPFKRNLSGKFWQYLGAFSFPIYLVHIPVMLSIGSWVCVHYGNIPALITTLVVTPIAAYPMLVFDKWWVKWVNRLTLFCFNAVKNKFVASSEHTPQTTLPLLPNQAA